MPNRCAKCSLDGLGSPRLEGGGEGRGGGYYTRCVTYRLQSLREQYFCLRCIKYITATRRRGIGAGLLLHITARCCVRALYTSARYRRHRTQDTQAKYLIDQGVVAAFCHCFLCFVFCIRVTSTCCYVQSVVGDCWLFLLI